MENKTRPCAVVRIHRPELTPEERARRMASIERAAAALILATLRAKKTEY